LSECYFLTSKLSQIDEGFAEDDLETNLQRDKHARLSSMVNQLIDELTPSAPDFQLRDACDQLVSYGSQRLHVSSQAFIDKYFERSAGDAATARVVAWNACYSRSFRREVFA